MDNEPQTPIPPKDNTTLDDIASDEKPQNYTDTDFKGPVIDYYKHKNILMTGVTGFIGKAILWKLIQALQQDIGTIYILIRSGSIKRSKIGRPSERLLNEIFNNKAFLILRRMMGKEIFDTIVKNKIIPVAGDLISPDLSMSEPDREKITENVNVVIHCAATLNYNERLDLALETNTLGTLRMMDLADECKHMEAFVHMSLAYTDPNLPDGHIQERVYPMQVGDPEELLREIVDLELQDIPKMTQRILAHYPNTYTFTKSLTEHLILKRVDLNRIEEAQGGKKQWPIAIIRTTQVGAGAFEPLPGWVDGVTGANGLIFLMGKGAQVLQPEMASMLANIVPVDYLVRVVLGSAAFMTQPGYRFLLPYNEVLEQDTDGVNIPHVHYFPYIYQVTACGFDETSWLQIYNAIRSYWLRNIKLGLPTAEEYFAINRSIFKAKFFMKYGLPQSLSSAITGKSGNDANSLNRVLELASRVVVAVQPFLRHRWVFDHPNVKQIEQDMSNDKQFNLARFKHMDWYTYIVNFSFGIHSYITPSPPLGLRNITVPQGWACSLYLHPGAGQHSIIDQQIESVVFSASDIQKRTERMLTELVASLEKPGQELKDKKKMEEWINDFDASLDDWCHDDSNLLKNKENMTHLGHWLNPSESYEEHIRIEVLNDNRVGQNIRQIIETSGVPQNTVVGEALKILQRMKERTQLPYIWSAGAFLNTLFKRLFTSVRINELDIAQLKEQIMDKNVVYVPVSKTILDQLIIWYICLRYNLPVPAIACDEALALLGPISDILRITGAYFVRRDLATRSPLNTAVTAAYTEVLLREHGALSLVVERARSRTGRLQTAYHDGLMNMIIDGTLSHNQQFSTNEPLSPTPTDSFSSISSNQKETVLVPINITYEKIPELRTLIDQVLDQKPRSITVSTSFLRPSATYADRAATKDNGTFEKGKYGRVFVGFGQVIDVRQTVQEAKLPANKIKRLSTIAVNDNDVIADYIIRKVQRGQHKAAVVSPVTLVAATLLFGRVSGGITMGKINQHVSWLRQEILEKHIKIDWQPDEDVSTIVAYSMNLLDARNNVTMDGGKRITDQTLVRVVEHADNVMSLSYMASQLIEIFLPEALFSVVYLSNNTAKSISKSDLFAQFTFLVQLFKHEFIYPWSRVEKFNVLLDWFIKKDLLLMDENGLYTKVVTIENNETEYTRVCLLASFIYPTLDAYWITSCSLSALRNLPYMPRKIVPVLSQWIAAHLITGRRTIYREVLSTEASQNAVDNFLAIGFIEAVHPKTKLSPDAQILLLELGVTTNEDLVMVFNQKNIEEEDLPSDMHESENILSRLEDIASLCHEIEKYRYVNDNMRHNAQVFEKCQNQIKSILRADQSYALQHGMKLERDEDQMIQLVYSLKAASSTPVSSDDGFGKHPRRVSQAYNLKS
ncbi:male sterility protein-domain-containing protein [Cokeromyces recurvatus]|uniref:male sterility protein-domain-containing protein n=1 Tax=Cokeromyces recurvatus TaxID=90255 RepID=UPI00221F3853|nr:male sterility protein-domain-containing protein [Cokeromyces recurvatus]KAI7899488.1 male sterility protein-domain-containing protein [Cokeromyces recurvatus]